MSEFSFLAAPAQRALASAKIQTLVDAAGMTEEQLLDLHGMGPNAMRKLKDELLRRGLQFARQA